MSRRREASLLTTLIRKIMKPVNEKILGKPIHVFEYTLHIKFPFGTIRPKDRNR